MARRSTLSARSLAATFLVFGLILVGTSAYCRPWKPTPNAIAMDYSQISDNRSGKEFVFMWWVNPVSLATISAVGRDILSKYVVVGAAHAHVSSTAIFTFDDIPDLAAKSGSASLTPLSGDAIPPTVAGFLATLEGALRRGLGQMGQGTHWFVFDAGPLQACEKGGLAIPLADETYTWETPIPGCPAK